jgi:hypothetical protein
VKSSIYPRGPHWKKIEGEKKNFFRQRNIDSRNSKYTIFSGSLKTFQNMSTITKLAASMQQMERLPDGPFIALYTCLQRLKEKQVNGSYYFPEHRLLTHVKSGHAAEGSVCKANPPAFTGEGLTVWIWSLWRQDLRVSMRDLRQALLDSKIQEALLANFSFYSISGTTECNGLKPKESGKVGTCKTPRSLESATIQYAVNDNTMKFAGPGQFGVACDACNADNASETGWLSTCCRMIGNGRKAQLPAGLVFKVSRDLEDALAQCNNSSRR